MYANLGKAFYFFRIIKNFIKILFFIAVISSSFFVLVDSVQAAAELVKSSSSDTVYYIDNDNIRHAFPNLITYQSWFGGDFSQIEIVSSQKLASYLLGSNVVMRPGKYLVKVPSSPKVYAVEPGGVLRHLTSEKVVKDIYGSNWELRLKDLPEIFFGNYSIGDRIDFKHQIPDGVIYQIKGEDKYYWKNKGIIEPFKFWSDVKINGYEKQDVIIGDQDIFEKLKPIIGRDNRIFNLSLAQNISTATCNTNNFSAAIIFITQDELDSNEIKVMQVVVDNLESSFSKATDNLSQLIVNPNLLIFNDKDGFLVKQDQNNKSILNLEELTLEFYETEPDKYDFLIVFNDFLEPFNSKEKASYTLVRNDFKGTNRILLNRSRFHGSKGRLKGIINMNKISQYSVASMAGKISLLNTILHEILHHWSGSVSFIVDDPSTGSTSSPQASSGQRRSFNLLENDKLHWSKWLNIISPLGGWGWFEQNGKFVSGLTKQKDNEITKFTDLDLYLMGLLPARAIAPIKYLVPDEPNNVNDTMTGVLQEVTIDQIIDAHGIWKCKIN